GGYFRETYRCADVLPASALPACYGRDKSAATAIYYLLTPETCSALHRLPTDEVFHLYLGGPVHILQLGPEGGKVAVLGHDLANGQRPQIVVPRGVWQGSCLAPGSAFALMGTTVTPAFDFPDFEPASRAALSAAYPEWAELI